MSLDANPSLANGPPQLLEVADQVYAYFQPDGSWWINNTGFVVGSSSVTSIDACSTERRTRNYLASISSVTPFPVKELVNTHHHGDHTYGNSLFEGATIIGHENCRTQLIMAGLPVNSGIWEPVDWGNLSLAPPTVTYSKGLRLWSGDRPIDVTYVGQPAHTDNDSLVWLPEQGVLFCGDLLFNGGTPFLLMGSVTGAIDVLTHTLSAIPATTIVPGHGRPCDLSLIDTTLTYLHFVLDAATNGREADLSPLETARETDLGDFGEWLDSERIVGNLYRAFLDLTPGGGVVDVMAALRDMVAFNGGRALHCQA